MIYIFKRISQNKKHLIRILNLYNVDTSFARQFILSKMSRTHLAHENVLEISLDQSVHKHVWLMSKGFRQDQMSANQIKMIQNCIFSFVKINFKM